jgi:hypothetical protein
VTCDNVIDKGELLDMTELHAIYFKPNGYRTYMDRNGEWRYKFPPMLGPASAQPEGSYQWAECLGNELDCHVENVERDVSHLARVMSKLVAVSPSPWNVFPNPACGKIDTYLQLSCGLNHKQVIALMMMFGHDALAIKLSALQVG